MSLEIKVPTVGESITEVTVAQWMKNDGEHVEKDEILCELESDKASFEVPAEESGILKIQVQEGETADVGAVICTIEPAEGGQSAAPDAQAGQQSAQQKTEASSSSAPASTGEVIEMRVTPIAESITEVVIGEWLKEDGDHVEVDDELVEIETDKATQALPAEAAGTLRIVAQSDQTLQIGDLICKIEVTSGEGASSAPAASKSDDTPATQAAPAQQDGYAAGHPSPAAGKILAEKGIPTSEVQGSGPGGRITKADANQAQPKAQSAPPSPPSAPTPEAKEEAPQTPSAPGSRNATRKRMSSLRKTIARRLVSVKNETAMLTTFNEVDLKNLMDIRKKYKDQFKEKYEVGLGFMSFFTKAVCIALQEWPAVNAQIDGDEIVYNDFCDISIAVSTPRGLVVPVIRNAEGMSFDQIEKEIIRLAKKARDGKLSIPEMTGGTFTITNGGVFGSMMSTPIINAPQSAILGMHNIVQRPMAVNGQVEIRPMMYVALSYDHRIIDGRESVSFLVRVKELLEDPIRLMVGV